MDFKRAVSIVVLLILFSLSRAQSVLYTDGDTIGVSRLFKTCITFPEAVQRWDFICPSGDYLATKKQSGKNGQLFLSTGVDSPAEFCNILVYEGPLDNPRQHKFTIVLQNGSEFQATEAVYDYSDLAAMIDKKKEADKHKKIGKPHRSHSAAANTPDATSSVTSNETAAATDLPSEKQPVNASQKASTQNVGDIVLDDGQVIPKAYIDAQVSDLIKRFKNLVEGMARHEHSVQSGLNSAMKYLFSNHHEVIVQVTTKAGVKTSRILQYLTDLSRLPYKRVDVSYSDLQYVSGFHKKADGTYSATIVITQRFAGVGPDGKNRYEDVTKKTMEVILEVDRVVRNGKEEKIVRVFLGNISVAENG